MSETASESGWWHAENHVATAGLAAALEIVHCREAAAVRVAGLSAVAVIVAAVYGFHTWLRVRSSTAAACPPPTLGDELLRAFGGTAATSPRTGDPSTAPARPAS